MSIVEEVTVNDAGPLITSNLPLVMLVGSGISGWAPTALPTGQQFTEGLLDLLLQDVDWSKDAIDPDIARNLLQEVPFEVLNEAFPDPLALPAPDRSTIPFPDT